MHFFQMKAYDQKSSWIQFSSSPFISLDIIFKHLGRVNSLGHKSLKLIINIENHWIWWKFNCNLSYRWVRLQTHILIYWTHLTYSKSIICDIIFWDCWHFFMLNFFSLHIKRKFNDMFYIIYFCIVFFSHQLESI